MDAAALLDDAARCVLAVRGGREPVVASLAHWFDGDAVWITTPADSVEAAALQRDTDCTVVVAPTTDRAGVTASGRARVHTPADPVRFALHLPAITGAVSALAARHPGALAASAVHASRSSPGRAHLPLVVRIALDDLHLLARPGDGDPARRADPDAPPPPVGVGPPLPTALPADVRRPLSGARAGAAVWDAPPLCARPVSWGAGFALAFPGAGPRPPAGQRLSLVFESDGGTTAAVGAALHGEVDAAGVLTADRVTWWRGHATERGEVAAASSPGGDLPE